MKKGTVVKEATVNTSVSEVWEAITDKKKMKQWYFDIKDFKAEVGSMFKFYGENKNRTVPTTCKVIEVKPNKKLAYTWSYDDSPAETIVTFELFDKKDKTRIKLTHAELDKIPTVNKDFFIENHIEGWGHIICKSLKEYVEKTLVHQPF